MKHLKKLGLATAMTLVATCGMVSTAAATTIEPANTEFTLTSINSRLIVDPEGTPVTCSSSIITGTTGALTHGTWASATVSTLTYASCLAFGLTASVTPSEGCHTPAGKLSLEAMTVSPSTAIGTITVPASCSFDINIPATGCTVTVTGGQTIGNGTAGSGGGIHWTNLSPMSQAHLNDALVPKVDSNGVGLGCPAAGSNHVGTLTGTYNLGATNVTITG